MSVDHMLKVKLSLRTLITDLVGLTGSERVRRRAWKPRAMLMTLNMWSTDKKLSALICL